MKISPRKKGQIYDLVHAMILERRQVIMQSYLIPYKLGDKEQNKIDYQIAQLEIPLAQAIIKLLQGKTKE